MQRLTPTEQSVMAALDFRIQSGDAVSLTKIAEECCVSKSMVTKTVKKLGYAGFKDLVEQLDRPGSDVDDNLLLSEFLEGDVLEVSEGLARLIWANRDRKNMVSSSLTGGNAILADYLSRKMAMFDISCPATYDYATAISPSGEPGLAFLFLHSGPARTYASGTTMGVNEPMLRLLHRQRYHIVGVSDDPAAEQRTSADTFVLISPERDDGLDFFAAKVTMLFEFVWSALSEISKAGC